ncbi:Holliday junction branch migration protein RuvA [Chloroflexota bacterium]
MIASLRGLVATVDQDSVVLQVGGMGFRVHVPKTLLEDAGLLGKEVVLFTYLHVRESELSLYGCRSKEEIALFRLLLTVSGVGPKVALSILSCLPPNQLRSAIVQEDLTLLARVPGIGPKTARKLAFDLHDKVVAELPGGAPEPILTDADADLVSALTSLGYSVNEAREAIGALPREPLPMEEKVRQALAYFAR